MNHSRSSILVGMSLILLACPAFAQLPEAKPTPAFARVAGRDKAVAKAEAEQIRKERQSQARALLFSLVNDARSFRDQTLRTRSLARIADALWGVAAEQGRTLFREAWKAAETAEQESQRPLNLRREVLTLAARRDRLLASEFLKKLNADQQENKVEPAENDSWSLPGASEQRLTLAKNLLSTGDIERALQFADPVLGNITISTVEFFTLLREKEPAAADRRYAAMLANTGVNLLADANTISLLSSYLFTPHMYVIFGTDGGASSSTMRSSFSPASVEPRLQLAFFQTASSVLLRPQLPPEQDQSTAGIVGKYMVLKRLLPLFEQYAPKEITDAVRGQFEAINSLVSDGVRQSENEWIQKGISPRKQLLADQEHSLLEQVERARTSDERDELYFQLALLTLGNNDMRARDYVSKIDASSFRKQAQAWVDGCLAFASIEKKKIETALELARNGELTHIQRVWLFAQAAKLLAKTDRVKALSLLDEAMAEARRLDGLDADRPRGLLAIANALKLIEPARAWEAAFDAVKAANSTEGFTGEDGVLVLAVNSKSRISKRTEAVPDFDLEGIFSTLASADYDRAIQLARGFQGEAPRANATIAIARAVLNEKSTPLPTTQPATKN